MAKQTLPDFAPEFRVVNRGPANNSLIILFDTATDQDLKRSPRLVVVSMEGVSNISVELEPISVTDEVVHQHHSGKINLITKTEDETVTKSYLLADFTLEVAGSGKPDAAGKLIFPAADEIEQLVRQGVADAFADASLEMIYSTPHADHPQAHAAPMQGGTGAWAPRFAHAPAMPAFAPAGGSARGSAAGKASWSKKHYAVVGVLALVLIVSAFKLLSSNTDPVQQAVNNALANDPRSRDEQVEITRQTLKEMGLDPGKNGDLGCLAAP